MEFNYFPSYELKCRCHREECDAVPMNPAFMNRVIALRKEWGIPLRVTSGSRCKFWNAHEKGAPRSFHLYGMAIDFWFPERDEVEDFIVLAEKFGFMGIGYGQHKVHLDGRKRYERWTY